MREALVAVRGNVRALKFEFAASPKVYFLNVSDTIDIADNVHLTVERMWSSVVLLVR